MRQLDLFGTFSEVIPGEKPEDKPAVLKKEEPTLALNRQASYSKNVLRSEQLVQDALPIKNEDAVAEAGNDAGINDKLVPNQSNLFLSLFDDSAGQQKEKPLNNIASNVENNGKKQKVTAFITHEIDEAEFVLKEPGAARIEESLEPFVDTNIALPTEETSLTLNDRHETDSEVDIHEQKRGDGLKESAEPSIDTTVLVVETVDQSANDLAPVEVIIDKRKVVPGKPAAYSLPELQRNGEVVFDDGKITVKIKNKSPFPAPVVKVKKEKVKKIPQKRGRKSFKEIDAEVDLIQIPEDEVLFLKQYYAISEVAKWFRVNTSLLRYWENEFDVLKPRKNRKGDRLFRPEDVKNLQLIYQLLRQKKYTIEGAKEYIKTNKRKADIQLQLTNTLQKFRSFLLDMKANLQS